MNRDPEAKEKGPCELLLVRDFQGYCLLSWFLCWRSYWVAQAMDLSPFTKLLFREEQSEATGTGDLAVPGTAVCLPC